MQWADVKEFIVKIVLGMGSGFFLYPVRVTNHFPQLKSVDLSILLILSFIYIFEGRLHYVHAPLSSVSTLFERSSLRMY
jgi:hypothetical protein